MQKGDELMHGNTLLNKERRELRAQLRAECEALGTTPKNLMLQGPQLSHAILHWHDIVVEIIREEAGKGKLDPADHLRLGRLRNRLEKTLRKLGYGLGR